MLYDTATLAPAADPLTAPGQDGRPTQAPLS